MQAHFSVNVEHDYLESVFSGLDDDELKSLIRVAVLR